MSHELELNAHGQASMFSVKEVPWHGLGTILDAPPTIEEGIKAAGLDWDVKLQPLHMVVEGEDMPVPGYATMRDTDRAILGVVGPTYKPLQNRDAFKWFQPFLDAKAATLETAGSLRGGKRVWVMAALNRDPIEVVPGDVVRKYVMLSNSHDGTLAIRAGFSGIRVVCANTLAMAHSAGESKLLSIRHTKGSTEALEKVREIMDLADRRFAATAEQFRRLAAKGVTTETLKKYVQVVFQPKVEADLGLDIADDAAARILAKVTEFFENGQGQSLPGVSGTAWAAYNAVTEYLSYERGRSNDSRMNSLWFGDAAKLNEKALVVACQMVG